MGGREKGAPAPEQGQQRRGAIAGGMEVAGVSGTGARGHGFPNRGHQEEAGTVAGPPRGPARPGIGPRGARHGRQREGSTAHMQLALEATNRCEGCTGRQRRTRRAHHGRYRRQRRNEDVVRHGRADGESDEPLRCGFCSECEEKWGREQQGKWRRVRAPICSGRGAGGDAPTSEVGARWRLPLDSKDRARGEREDEDGADRWGPGVSGWARGAGVRCWAGGCLAELGWRGAGPVRCAGRRRELGQRERKACGPKPRKE